MFLKLIKCYRFPLKTFLSYQWELFFSNYLKSVFLLIFIFLSGCANVSPNKLGISQSDWDEYSPAKKDQLVSAYEQTQKRKRTADVSSGSGVLSVHIEGGKALLPPYTNLTAYQPTTFTVKQGNCEKKIPIMPVEGSDQPGHLEVCYKSDTLYLDPSPYDPNLFLGSLAFPYMPTWKRGFTYLHVNSAGLLKLTDVNIFLRQLVSADAN